MKYKTIIRFIYKIFVVLSTEPRNSRAQSKKKNWSHARGVCTSSISSPFPPVFGMHGGTRRFHCAWKEYRLLLRFVKRVARVGVVVVLKKIGFKVRRSSIYRANYDEKFRSDPLNSTQ